MRFSTFARWIIVLGVLGWAGYTVAGAGWSYLAIQEIVDKALREASSRHRIAFATGSQTSVDALDALVRDSILLDARHGGFPLQKEDVSVSANSVGMSAAVHWTYPLISYQGRDMLVIPLSLQRSFVPTSP